MKNKQCFEIIVEDPSCEFERMRDKYDIKLIINNGFFSVFEEKLKIFTFDKITSENYEDFKLQKNEIEKIKNKLKLTKSRVS